MGVEVGDSHVVALDDAADRRLWYRGPSVVAPSVIPGAALLAVAVNVHVRHASRPLEVDDSVVF